MWRKRLARVGLYLGAVVILITILGPYVWLILTSLKPNTEIYGSYVTFLPETWTLDNYRWALFGIPGMERVDVIGGMQRSLFAATGSSVIAVSVASLASYALARFNFAGKNSVMGGMLLTQAIPAILLVIPLFLILRTFRLTNSVWGLIIAYITIALPFCIFMLSGYFKSIPLELEDAAAIDGCNRLQTLYRIVLPLAAPGMVATFIYAFIVTWNEFLLAFILVPRYPTLSVSLYGFTGQLGVFWGPLIAGSVMATLPVALLFLPFQRYLVGGMTAGAVKS